MNKPLITTTEQINVKVMLELVRENLSKSTIDTLENKVKELEDTYNNWSMNEKEFKEWMSELKQVHDKHEGEDTKVRDLVEVETENDLEENVLDLNVHSFLNLRLNSIKEAGRNKYYMPFDISLS